MIDWHIIGHLTQQNLDLLPSSVITAMPVKCFSAVDSVSDASSIASSIAWNQKQKLRPCSLEMEHKKFNRFLQKIPLQHILARLEKIAGKY